MEIKAERLQEAIATARDDLNSLIAELKRAMAAAFQVASEAVEASTAAPKEPGRYQVPASFAAALQAHSQGGNGSHSHFPFVVAPSKPPPVQHELPLKFEKLRNSVSVAVAASEECETLARQEYEREKADSNLMASVELLRKQNQIVDDQIVELMKELRQMVYELGVLRKHAPWLAEEKHEEAA